MTPFDDIYKPNPYPESSEVKEKAKEPGKLDPNLLSRARNHLNKYPGDTEVADAYNAYQEVANAAAEQNEVAEDNLILELGIMEKHYKLKAHVTKLRVDVDNLVAKMGISQKRFDDLSAKRDALVGKDIPGVDAGIKQFGQLIDVEVNRYYDLYDSAREMVRKVDDIEGMRDDDVLDAEIGVIDARIVRMENDVAAEQPVDLGADEVSGDIPNA